MLERGAGGENHFDGNGQEEAEGFGRNGKELVGMGTLYELTAEMQQLMDWMNDPEVDDQAINDTLEGLQFELEEKAEQYCMVIRQLEADEEAFKREAERFAAKAAIRRNNAKRMKDALQRAMVLTGNERGLNAGLFQLKLAGNGGKKPLVIDGQVPERFINYTPTFDNDAIRRYLESDEGRGCDWAHLEERGKHLSIK